MSASSDDKAARGPNTALVNAGRDPFAHNGFVNTPVYHGSTVLYPNAEALFSNTIKYSYGRRHSPTIDALAGALSELEGAAGTVLTPSGLSAVTTAILSAVGAGDHFLVTDSVYHPARHFCDTTLKRLGVETTYYDPLIGAGISDLLRPNTKAVLTESPGSLTFEVQDVPAIAAAAHARGALVLMDNTWATPLFFQPLDTARISPSRRARNTFRDMPTCSSARSPRMKPHGAGCATRMEILASLSGPMTYSLRCAG